ncbi:hypothetical protein FACS189490_04260 [Clostridia bacterium]|nr:hypothetical protein FACS189490_04260 [Clostridia bacterium]
MANDKTNCMNGELAVGEQVLSLNIDLYKYLVGTVTRIDKADTPEHDATDNETDDVLVNFNHSDYSEQRLRDMETYGQYLLGRGRHFDRSRLDEVVMAPGHLLRIEGLSREDLDAALDSEAGAETLCHRLLAEVGKGIDADGAIVDLSIAESVEGAALGNGGAEVETFTEKLYSPLFVELGAYDEDGDYYCGSLSQKNAAEYAGIISEAILDERLPEEAERGLMTYYRDGGAVGEKVHSLFVGVEVHGGKLWGVATLGLTEPLNAGELETLKEYIIGQYADGFGEGFEQHEIKIRDGDLYVHLWDSSDAFYIDTEQAFAQRLGVVTTPAVERIDTPEAPMYVPGEPYGGSVVGGAMTTEKLYSPLEFYLHNPREEEENGEYGMYDLYDEQYKISHVEAWESLDAIELTLRREVDRLDKVHGLAEYLPDELRAKVWSLFPAIENFGDSLYFVAKVELTEPLTAQELALLKDRVSAQWSDGFGEGLEQREIQIGGGNELYVVPWSSDDGKFFIDTEREFRQRLGLEPLDSVKETTPFETVQSQVEVSPRVMLHNKLTAEIEEYRADLLMRPNDYIADMSYQTAFMREAYSVLTSEPDLSEGQISALLAAEAPLREVAEALKGCYDELMCRIEIDTILEEAHIQASKEGAEVAEEAAIGGEAETPAHDTRQRGETVREEQSGYTSVMDRINADKAAKRARQAEQKGAGDRQTVPKSKNKRKSKDEEL